MLTVTGFYLPRSWWQMVQTGRLSGASITIGLLTLLRSKGVPKQYNCHPPLDTAIYHLSSTHTTYVVPQISIRNPRRVCEKLCYSINSLPECRQWFLPVQDNRVSTHKEMHMASSVFVGTVTAAQPVPETWDFLDGVNYTVRVDSKIHGKARTQHRGDGFQRKQPALLRHVCWPTVCPVLAAPVRPLPGGQLRQFTRDNVRRFSFDQTAETEVSQGFLSLNHC